MSDVIVFPLAGLDNVPKRWTTAEFHAADRDGCDASAPGRGYFCTGPEGHDGPHFADGVGRCVAMWRDA